MTRMTVTSNPSPLGDLSPTYRVRGAKGYTGILDRPQDQELEFYPAGYTQFSERDNINRQETLRAIFQAAKEQETEEKLFPLGKKHHWIELEHEFGNRFDEHAVKMILKTSRNSVLSHIDDHDLGYVPKRISAEVFRNLEMLGKGKIFKVKEGHHKKYFGIKLVFPYGGHVLDPERKNMSRFKRLAKKR